MQDLSYPAPVTTPMWDEDGQMTMPWVLYFTNVRYVQRHILATPDLSFFDDATAWTPFYGDPAAVRMKIAHESVSFLGLKTYNVSPNNGPNFIGLVSRSTFHPSPTTGLLKVKVNFDSYINAIDQTTIGHAFYFGMMILCGTYLSGSTAMGTAAILGKVSGSSPIVKRTAILSQCATPTGTPFGTIWDTSTSYTIIDGASFAFEMQFGARTSVAGTARNYGHIQTLITGTGGVTSDTLNNTSADTSNTYDSFAFMNGVRFAVGCWPNQNSTIGSARLIGFSLIEGEMHPQTL